MCCPSHRLEDGQWLGPTSIYRAPVAVKAEVTSDEASGLTGVAAGQEGPPDDPGGHHVAALAPPQEPPETPRNARIEQKAPGRSGISEPTDKWLRPPRDLSG